MPYQPDQARQHCLQSPHVRPPAHWEFHSLQLVTWKKHSLSPDELTTHDTDDGTGAEWRESGDAAWELCMGGIPVRRIAFSQICACLLRLFTLEKSFYDGVGRCARRLCVTGLCVCASLLKGQHCRLHLKTFLCNTRVVTGCLRHRTTGNTAMCFSCALATTRCSLLGSCSATEHNYTTITAQLQQPKTVHFCDFS